MNETMNTLLHRASPRSFTKKHVEKEKLDLILKAGLKAPSGVNLQTPRFIVVTNDGMVKKLSELNAKAAGGSQADPFYGAPDVIVVLAVKERCWQYDGPLAMGNMLNAAYSLGVDSRWIHRAKEVFYSEEGKEILKNLGVEEDVEGIGFCILGYSEENPEAKEIKENRVYYID